LVGRQGIRPDDVLRIPGQLACRTGREFSGSARDEKNRGCVGG